MATEAQIRAAFQKGVRDTLSGASYGALRDAISRGDYQAALAAVDIEDAAFDEMRRLIVQTYAEGGVDAISGVRWPVNTRWNSATPEAEYFARNTVGQNITWITNDMREAVRWTMGDGIALGRSNNRIALDIVGRVGPSGQREGGIVGLNRLQAQWVRNYREKLLAGEFPSNTLLTAAERRLIEKGNLTAAQIDRLTQSYSNRLLLSRGKTIARTERGLAVNLGRMEGYRQGADKAGIPLSALRKEWVHRGAHKHERYEHVSLSRDPAIPFTQPFDVNGYSAQMPHDPSLPASEVISCSCEVKVSIPKGWRNG